MDAFVARVNASGTALDYCGYIGGASSEAGYGIAVDGQGNAYVSGYTQSTESTFPVAIGPDLTHNGQSDAFVARVNANGTALDYCGYIGGFWSDSSTGIALDGLGNAHLVGWTDSPESTFPVTVGPDLTYNGDGDAFVVRVNPSGVALDYCGYIGGSASDSAGGISVDGQGNAYVVGYAKSTESTFPVTVGPDLTYNGNGDSFVAKVKSNGTALDYCGYIGGAVVDTGTGIAVDGRGNAYVAGWTNSPHSSFPVITGPDLTFNGYVDAFVARVNSTGTILDYCGYIGGREAEKCYGVAVDMLGNAFVAGYTLSDETTFPVIVGPDLTYSDWEDAFVAKVEYSDFTLASTPDPIVAGQSASFSVAGATPLASAWLAYSLNGPGATPIPALGVTLAITNPVKAEGPTMTDASGALSWTLPIPLPAQGRIVYFQAVQFGKTSNVMVQVVQ